MVALDLKLCAKALHVFFNDDRLRCYLKDILSDKQVKGDKNKGYNPLFLYILSLVSIIYLNNNLYLYFTYLFKY